MAPAEAPVRDSEKDMIIKNKNTAEKSDIPGITFPENDIESFKEILKVTATFKKRYTL